MSAILKLWRHIRNLTPSIELIYLKHTIAKRHLDLISNDNTALGFFEEGRTNSKNHEPQGE